MTNKLVEIGRENWLQLRNLYPPHHPDTFLGYSLVDNYIRWFEKDPNVKNIIFYCLNGDWSDGTFVVIDRNQIHVNTLSESKDRLFQLLQLVDFRTGLHFALVQEKFHSTVLEAIKERNLKLGYDMPMLMHFLHPTEALKLDDTVPDGITLAPLNVSHAKSINDVWPHRECNSLFFLERSIKFNINIGAFTSDGKLVAWLLRMQGGPVLALQVDKDYYGRGLGMLVSKILSKKIAELGHSCVACVLETNTPSRAIFEKLGYKVVDNVYWIGALPENEHFEWNDD